ncbi:nucleoporin [Trichophyton mentagrophytes]|uniref:Nucleoporin n=2 Tax=Trichophyton interdigitale TaxID=101480 RepID=A0A9P5CZ63_9EURO|nr:hypothetical protein H101_05353 [Trichophyton interdigitale H6]KAF3896105.1 Nucleoporin [Trichophyton interdigitale]KDB21794.1 hypothetical protein H109_06254 [Trichophyton interdigitale MR816]GBF61486.1 nucleoporin [Trichophyton mentagrophytes]KAG5207973.1 Nucleoporin [Trichophyton interdigitale]
MEYHSVPLEERAKDEKGNTLPWGYLYKDESRNPRRPPEETGPFGKRRNTRYGSTRSATRTGTPAKRENPNVAEFGRLFSLQQEEEAQQKLLAANNTTSNDAATSRTPGDAVATECILYGYKDKGVEWKVIDKFERISLGYICEDYSRTDPEINPKYPQLLSGGDVVIRPKLSADANRKSKRYAGGAHWIKVTFDSFSAADRACHFSPQEIDGCLVYCEMYRGHGPQEDAPIPKATLEQQSRLNSIYPSLKPSTSASLLQSTEYDRSSLPRSFSYTQSNSFEAPASVQSTATASSATVMGQNNIDADAFRQRPGRSQPEPEPEAKPAKSEFMTHIPTVRRAVVRPASEALPPQPSMTERVLRSIPILSWFTGDIVGDGPALREDGSFDDQKSNLYWRFWHMVDMVLGTDLCGLREEI